MSDLLAHPLTVLVVGAGLTGILVPALTRRWQVRQKELEVKALLVGDLSEAIMEILMAVQFIRVRTEYRQLGIVGPTSEEQREDEQKTFSQAYRLWEIRSAVLGTKLEAYFAETTIPSEWTTFSEIVTRFYALEGVPEHQRQDRLDDLLGKLLPELPPEQRRRQGWLGLKEAILNRKREIIRKVLRSSISAFQSGLLK